jgi:hypothetical protein
VLAGSEVGFRVSYDGNGKRDPVKNPVPHFWHPGPGLIYLSRAPNDDLQNYKGDGDWFKIAYAGPTDDQHWSLWPGVSDVRLFLFLMLGCKSNWRMLTTGLNSMSEFSSTSPSRRLHRLANT